MKLLSRYARMVSLVAILFFISCKKEPEPPIANAGPDQTITLPVNSVTLDGSASKPGNHNITTYIWYKLSGPGTATMSSAYEAIKQVTNLVAGSYEFLLKITDAAGLTSTDNVKVTVLPVPLNNDPLNIKSGTATLSNFGSLSQAKFVVPATAADKLVFAGGHVYLGNNWQPTSLVDIYNLTANTWSTTQLSESRSNITVATVSNKILYAGGMYNNGGSTSRVDIYDAAVNIWSTASLSITRNDMRMAVAGKRVFFAGGEYSEITNTVDIYDASSNSWSTAALSEARNGMSVIAAGNKVLFAGGYKKFDGFYENPYDFSTRVDIYDIATNRWSTAELKEARSGMAAATAGNKILFAGGSRVNDRVSGQGAVFSIVDVYDVSTNTWSATALSEEISGMAAATVGSKVLFAGGGSSRVHIYDAATNSWSAATLSQPRHVSSTVTLGNKVLFFTGHPTYNRMDIYDASANTWSAAEFNKSLYSFPIVAGNKVFIGGGEVHTVGSYADKDFVNNVWKLEF